MPLISGSSSAAAPPTPLSMTRVIVRGVDEERKDNENSSSERSPIQGYRCRGPVNTWDAFAGCASVVLCGLGFLNPTPAACGTIGLYGAGFGVGTSSLGARVVTCIDARRKFEKQMNRMAELIHKLTGGAVQLKTSLSEHRKTVNTFRIIINQGNLGLDAIDGQEQSADARLLKLQLQLEQLGNQFEGVVDFHEKMSASVMKFGNKVNELGKDTENLDVLNGKIRDSLANIQAARRVEGSVLQKMKNISKQILCSENALNETLGALYAFSVRLDQDNKELSRTVRNLGGQIELLGPLKDAAEKRAGLAEGEVARLEKAMGELEEQLERAEKFKKENAAIVALIEQLGGVEEITRMLRQPPRPPGPADSRAVHV